MSDAKAIPGSGDEMDHPIHPAPTDAGIYAVANLFALAGFFLHPLLHWWVRSSPSMECVMHGYTSLGLYADGAVTLRFFLVWTGEIIALWLVGAGAALVARGIARSRERG